MTEDARCCGSGTCIIDTEGRCWCGQQWDGRAMSAPQPMSAAAPVLAAVAEAASPQPQVPGALP